MPRGVVRARLGASCACCRLRRYVWRVCFTVHAQLHTTVGVHGRCVGQRAWKRQPATFEAQVAWYSGRQAEAPACRAVARRGGRRREKRRCAMPARPCAAPRGAPSPPSTRAYLLRLQSPSSDNDEACPRRAGRPGNGVTLAGRAARLASRTECIDRKGGT